jgi:GTP cyclohydrolase I
LTVLSNALRTVLECIGEDPDREGLQRTPERYAKALLWMTKGYEERLVDVINDAVFAEDHDEMVIVRDIDVFSLCEHHMVPFTGKVGRRFRAPAHGRSRLGTSRTSLFLACRSLRVSPRRSRGGCRCKSA